MQELCKNDIFEALIEGYTSEGCGVCRISGRAVFVKGALMGERVRVKIIKVTNTAVYGKLEEIVESSAKRIKPVCKAFPKCGGCVMQHADYDEELCFKKNKVDSAIERIGGIKIKTSAINGADTAYGYRNKAIFAVGGETGNAYYGFFRKHSHEVIRVEKCAIQADYSCSVGNTIISWMNRFLISPYDETTKSGCVRHIFSRYAFKTKEGQVTLVVYSRPKYLDELVKSVLEECPETVSIVLNINRTHGNTVLGGSFETIWGRDYLEEELCNNRFRLSPKAFFQINRDQAEKLYNKAAEYAQLDKTKTVLDLYCGAGTITMKMAKEAKYAIGVEIVPDAIANAINNAKINDVNNIEFICADAFQAAKMLKEKGNMPDVVVVDPPRKGLERSVIDTIADICPDRVVYISCEPSTLARDLKIFCEHGYNIKSLEAFDLFPRTEHVETCALLVRECAHDDEMVSIKVDLDGISLKQGEYKPDEKPTYGNIKAYIKDKYGFNVTNLYIGQVKDKLGLEKRQNYNIGAGKGKVPTCPKEKEDAIMDAFRHFGLI